MLHAKKSSIHVRGVCLPIATSSGHAFESAPTELPRGFPTPSELPRGSQNPYEFPRSSHKDKNNRSPFAKQVQNTHTLVKRTPNFLQKYHRFIISLILYKALQNPRQTNQTKIPSHSFHLSLFIIFQEFEILSSLSRVWR